MQLSLFDVPKRVVEDADPYAGSAQECGPPRASAPTERPRRVRAKHESNQIVFPATCAVKISFGRCAISVSASW